jgi:cupin superfamily acireductone dioxygenase involved in methionine salvage
MFSNTSKKVKKLIISKDKRGEFISLINHNLKNLSIITSFPKSIRSNHLHKRGWHYMYILSGIMVYFFKKKKKIFYLKLKKGDLIFTPPKELHATYFPVKTVFVVASKNKREKKTYEKDTVRKKFIDFKNLKSIRTNAHKIK